MAVTLAAQLIHEIEQGIIELRKEYTMFLNDITNIEPFASRDQLQKKVKRLRNLNFNRTEDQFRANNLIAQVNSHFQLWDRQLERKYTGDPHLRKRKPPKQAEAPPEKKKKSGGVIIGAGAANQREQVESLYDAYMKLNLSLGASNVINFTKFQNFIENQTEKIKAKKGVDKVRYEVAEKDGKVIIKSRTVDT
jgi:hypothetical protein